jgi:enolase-phosphatase E1
MRHANKIEAIVTDIEGTTSALSFVKEVLFPYAQERLAGFVARNAENEGVRDVLDDVRKIENNPGLTAEECVSVLLKWSAEDKKIRPLKTLQGMIWEDGYVKGVFKGHIYEDAVLKLKEWHASGMPLYIYSSGSVPAQKLLFRHTPYGDLTPLFSGYFDTAIGAKVEAQSYAKIASNLGKDACQILFLSDHIGELDAAQAAGFSTILLDRDNAAENNGCHRRMTDFTSISLTEIT